jgi:outer membrane protein assembly factor BamD
MRKFALICPLFFLLLSCGGRNADTADPVSGIDEPDRTLFERAMRDIEKNRFTVGRLSLQTLINTYPDSEYLPQAKYAMAESFFRENSSASLSQAENEFKDYITFFPADALADDAQLKIAMTHIRRIEKADRDNTQAKLAEIELKAMIEEHPDSDLLDEAKRDLRAVQEVLADGVYGVGNFYMLRRNYAAAVSRYKEVMLLYPDYTKMPEALFSLAQALKGAGNGEEAVIYYARVVTEHPAAKRAEDAKEQLAALNQPIPDPNPAALARALQNPPQDKGILSKMIGMFKSRPSVPTETSAASDATEAGTSNESAPAPVRGGTAPAAAGASSNDSGGANTTFGVDAKAVDKPEQPKKP